MLFNSWQFLAFFPVVTFLYFALPNRYHNLFLLTASCFFYMVFIPAYILVLAFLIVVDYFAGIWIEQAACSKRKAFLILSLVSNIGLLGFFKYFNFFNANLALLAQAVDWNYSVRMLAIALPIGLSFHTFQAMSYTIEVYRGKQMAEKRFLNYALYVMFFPQLVAGPIERPQNLLPQFDIAHTFDEARIKNGLYLMLWGMFKKVVIADRLALIVNQIYRYPEGYPGLLLMLATVAFAFEIYCDFSGYSDIAIGAAQVMGIKLMNNFNRPYFADSISDFWRRWHISLSTWFRDYVYLPLGGNRVSKLRWGLNILTVFVISGFWHGANWTYVVWGALHGAYLTVERFTETIRMRAASFIFGNQFLIIRKAFSRVFIFVLVCYAWIFFRSNTMTDALYISSHLFNGFFTSLPKNREALRVIFKPLNMTRFDFIIPFAGILGMECLHLLQKNGSVRNRLSQLPFTLRWGAALGLALAIMNLGLLRKIPFIYYQF